MPLQNRIRPLAAAFAFAALALAACSDSSTGPESMTTPTTPAAPETPAPPAPGRSFFAGAYLGDAASTPERIGAAIRDFGQLSGKQPALVKTYHTLNCDFTAGGWCGQLLRAVAGAGATNFVALDVRWTGGPSTAVLDAINAGQADARITALARGIRSVGSVVLMEPAWEMNGDWSFAWQGVQNGGASGPAKYVAAWRRIVDIFRREGADNVRWVWNPNVGNALTHTASGPAHWNWYGHYYPGGGYVDYVGAHGFNAPQVWGGSWQGFATMTDGASADRMLSDLAARYPDKPMIIGELATAEGSGDAKAAWIREAYRLMRENPRIVAAVWFHMDKEADWRIDSSAASLAAFREAMAVPGIETAFVPAAASRTLLAAR